MDNTQLQILNNFKSLFGRYKPVITQDDHKIQITIDKQKAEVNQSRSRQTQQHITKL